MTPPWSDAVDGSLSPLLAKVHPTVPRRTHGTRTGRADQLDQINAVEPRPLPRPPRRAAGSAPAPSWPAAPRTGCPSRRRPPPGGPPPRQAPARAPGPRRPAEAQPHRAGRRAVLRVGAGDPGHRHAVVRTEPV